MGDLLLDECIEPSCDLPRGGRNRYCWKHLKRMVRRNAMLRRWQTSVDTDPEAPGFDQDVRTFPVDH